MHKKAIEVLMVASIVAGVAGVFIKVMGSIPFSVSQTTTNKASAFEATGEGRAYVVPDRAEVTLGVRKTAKKVATAQNEANEVMKKLVDELRSMGIRQEDIKTTNYDIYPDYGVETGRPAGYVVASQVRVSIADFESIAGVLDLAGKYGLEQVGQLTFTLSDELREKALKQAREEAVKMAKEKAENLAKLAGVKLGRVINVQERDPFLPVMYRANSEMMLDKAQAQVNPGTSEVLVGVTISYETQ